MSAGITPQQPDYRALPVIEALRAIGHEERERVFRERFLEIFPGYACPELPAHRFPPPPRGIGVTSHGWKSVRKEANAAGEVWRRRADAIEACGTMVVVLRCRCCGHFWAIPDPCGSRFCPHCARAVRHRNIREVEKVVRTFAGRRRFLTLTMRSSHDLAGMLRNVQGALTRLRARTWWKEHVSGGIYATEVTHNSENGWHVHVHAILSGSYLPRPEVISEWQAASGCRCPRPRRRRNSDKSVLCCHSQHDDVAGEFQRADAAASSCKGCPVEPVGQDIRASHGDDVFELCKYVGKDLGTAGGFVSDQELLKEFLRVMWGRRMWSTFGEAFDQEREEAPKEPEPCQACGATDQEAIGRMSSEAWERQHSTERTAPWPNGPPPGVESPGPEAATA